MSQNGGPGAWIFIPCIFLHTPVLKQILLTLESQEVQLYLKHLNTEQWYRPKVVKKGWPVNPTCAARAAWLPRANWNNQGETPVRLQLMHGNGLTLNVVATDLKSAVSSAQSKHSPFSFTPCSYSLPTGLQCCEPSRNLRCIACTLVLVNK